MVIKQPECLLDLSQFDGASFFGHGNSTSLKLDEQTCCGQMMSARHAPVSPEDFESDLRKKVSKNLMLFTSKADLDVVCQQYERGFRETLDNLRQDLLLLRKNPNIWCSLPSSH